MMGKNFYHLESEDGIIRVLYDDINYINIEGRKIAFHLVNGDILLSHCLRKSFASHLPEFLTLDEFIFLNPALIINVKNIKMINKEFLVFKNDEKLFICKNKINAIIEEWQKK